MTWIEHSLVGSGIYIVSKNMGKPLSLSALLFASTLLMDLDHLWFRLALRTLLKMDGDLALGFWFTTGTWTHSIVYLLLVSFVVSRFFQERAKILTAFLLAGFFHLLGDWLYRQLMFDMGLMWFWPFSWKML